jgi:hypothetical protein
MAAKLASFSFDYGRRVRKVSLRDRSRLWIKAAALVAAALPVFAQYPGQVAQTDKGAPTVRAVAVFEWTGDEPKPKTSRLVPVSIYDGVELQDADEYLARPFPLALEGDVEYQLLKDGKPIGLFDVDTAAHEQGTWVGYGKRLPLPAAKPAPAQVAKIDEDDAQSDVPVLHRKHHDGDSSSGGASGGSGNGSGNGSGSASGPAPNAPPPDPDRPTLHKSNDTGSSTSGSPASNSGSTSDPDRPDPHRLPDSSAPTSAPSTSASSSSTSSNDSDHPKLKKKKKEEDDSYVDSVEKLSDPNRPHLFRGKAAGFDALVTPSLRGLPPDMHQEVAVSDATERPEHIWDYTWADPDDQVKMKAAMEELARTELGLNPPPAPAKPTHKSAATAHKRAQPAPPPESAPLRDEQFRVFELAYGSGATMVLSARTEGTGEHEKFVTLIAQPDLYGNVMVLVKNVTDAAHLDSTPRMRLVDAVDALADNRGELLFELRGATERQFALYRVLRGDAKRIFLSNPDAIGVSIGQ